MVFKTTHRRHHKRFDTLVVLAGNDVLWGWPDPLDIHTNAVLKLDTWLIGTKHLYMGEGFPFDPEGLLSTFPRL